MKVEYACPVCNYSMDDPPRDWNYCPCCGTQFDYHDIGTTHEELRQDWIKGGMKWWSPVRDAPSGWNPAAQVQPLLASIPRTAR